MKRGVMQVFGEYLMISYQICKHVAIFIGKVVKKIYKGGNDDLGSKCIAFTCQVCEALSSNSLRCFIVI